MAVDAPRAPWRSRPGPRARRGSGRWRATPSAKPTWASCRGGDHVPDGEDALLAGAHVLVDLDEAPVVELDARARRRPGRPTVAGGRPRRPPPPPSTSSPSPKCTVVPARRRSGVWPVTLTPVRTVDAPLLERAQHHVGDVLVAAGQDLGQRLEDGHLAAQVAHHRGELAADGPAADHDGRGRQPLEARAPRRRSARSCRRPRSRGWCAAPSPRPG